MRRVLIDTIRFNRVAILLFLTVFTVLAEAVLVPSSGRKFAKILESSKQGDTLLLNSGTYIGDFRIPPGVTVMSKIPQGAHIFGNGREKVITLTNDNVLYGLRISGGKIGVYSEGIDNEILACVITRNRQSGIVAVAHFVELKDNLIYRNLGSGIQLWDIMGGTNEIINNTIAYNENHGISVGGESEIRLINNIITYNGRFAVKAEELSKIFQEYNVYLSHIQINMALPEHNYSFDPGFINSGSNDFRLRPASRCYTNGRYGTDIGSRVYTTL